MTETATSTTSDAEDYAADATEANKPTADTLAQLTALASRADEVQREVDRIEAELEKGKDLLKSLVEKEIPDLMGSIKMTSFSTDDLDIKVKETLRVSLPKDKNELGIQFFDDHGRAGIVKRVVEISFNRDETAWANKFMADCARRKLPLRISMTKWVEPPTLKKEISDMIEAGEAVPREIFSVFPQRKATITRR